MVFFRNNELLDKLSLSRLMNFPVQIQVGYPPDLRADKIRSEAVIPKACASIYTTIPSNQYDQ